MIFIIIIKIFTINQYQNYYRDDGFDETEDDDIENQHVTYKIGDLGHVTSIRNPLDEEGDCRYLPQEILNEDFTNLTKADIFSLGMTLYEAGGGDTLPKYGQSWHDLRNGKIPDLKRLSRPFNDLIKVSILFLIIHLSIVFIAII